MLNVYNLIAIITISALSFVVIFAHYASIGKIIKKNEKDVSEIAKGLFPKQFIYVWTAVLICVLLPFKKSFALRWSHIRSHLNNLI